MIKNLRRSDVNKIFSSDKITIVCFYIDEFKPSLETLDEISAIVNGRENIFEVYKVDFLRHKDIAKKFEVLTVPTIIMFKKGDEKYRTSGTLDKRQLRNIIEYVKLS